MADLDKAQMADQTLPVEAAEDIIFIPKKFGTFQGVFTPTLLTILGVIMYLRAGWVVGNAGLVGAILIILLASGITFLTALSMSSITTNIRIKAGGAFSIISQSLGLEAGGAIGIPLYLAQALAVAMYIFGFREGWLWLFPDHSAIVVDLITFLLIFVIANISTDFAFKTQYVILAIIAASLISIGLAFLDTPLNQEIQLFGSYPGSAENGFSGASFWIVFAIFFPAVTGIMAGANMSGDLANPRSNIPKGTLSAVLLATVIYLVLAVALSYLATPEELVNNYNILIDKAFWPPLVLAGLLGATLSSALSSLVGAPRILFALGENNILVRNEFLAKTDRRGEPRNAFLLTSILVICSLLLRDLNAIAPLLTMFFLITYAMINVVVLIEQSLGQVSFRPTLSVPIFVPLLGTIGCFFAMFIINPTVSLVAIALVIAAYILLLNRSFETRAGDTRSGMFNAVAEWAARVVNKLPEAKERAWQPNLIVPAHHPSDVVRSYKILYSLADPKGSIKILGFPKKNKNHSLGKELLKIEEHFNSVNISCTQTVVSAPDFLTAMTSAMQAMRATFFRPNSIFLSLTDDRSDDSVYDKLLLEASQHGLGSYIYIPYKKVGLGLEKSIHLWIESKDIGQVNEHKHHHINLALLTSYILTRNWRAQLQITVLLDDTAVQAEIQRAMSRIAILSRMPKSTHYRYIMKDKSLLQEEEKGDLNITYLQPNAIEIEDLRRHTEEFGASFLFTVDSGLENAFA